MLRKQLASAVLSSLFLWSVVAFDSWAVPSGQAPLEGPVKKILADFSLAPVVESFIPNRNLVSNYCFDLAHDLWQVEDVKAVKALAERSKSW